MKNKIKELRDNIALFSIWSIFNNDNDKVLTDRGIDILEAENRVLVNGEELIGNAREVWDRIDHEGLDWQSFVNGWLEGRLDLIESREK
jgi:hypothetical protein